MQRLFWATFGKIWAFLFQHLVALVAILFVFSPTPIPYSICEDCVGGVSIVRTLPGKDSTSTLNISVDPVQSEFCAVASRTIPPNRRCSMPKSVNQCRRNKHTNCEYFSHIVSRIKPRLSVFRCY